MMLFHTGPLEASSWIQLSGVPDPTACPTRQVLDCILDASVLPCLLGLTSEAHLCLKQNSYQGGGRI